MPFLSNKRSFTQTIVNIVEIVAMCVNISIISIFTISLTRAYSIELNVQYKKNYSEKRCIENGAIENQNNEIFLLIYLFEYVAFFM